MTSSHGGPGEETLGTGIRVVGTASAEEVAAIVAVLVAASGGSEEPTTDASSPWASHGAILRRPMGHGPGTWRTSLRP